jgi:serine/threonine protein kinase
MRWWERQDAPVLGRYRIDRLLGEGGMARVFLATDLRNDRPVAFKTPKLESFPPEFVAELLARFSREFRSQAQDPIQGVIPIHESGEFTDADGVVRPFLVMQYLSGGSLGDLIGGDIGRRAHRQTLGEVLDWLVPIARTVDRLHARKYLHRDIKPDNILFNSDGDPFLADFGVVGSLDPSLDGATLSSGTMGALSSPGSPGYQSPESIQADPALRNVSASDQFSLAVTVYEALAGVLPAQVSTHQQWFGALMHWAPIPLSTPCPDLPKAASDVVMKAMAAQPRERFASCSEFAKALAVAVNAAQAVPAARASQAPPMPAAPVAGPPPASRSRRPLGIGLGVVALLAVGLYVAWPGADPSPPGQTAGASESVPPGSPPSDADANASNGPAPPLSVQRPAQTRVPAEDIAKAPEEPVAKVPDAPLAKPAQWTICKSNALTPDGNLVFSVSAPMDVGEVPDWFERLHNERPDRPSLDAAGVSRAQLDNGQPVDGRTVDRFFGTCTDLRPSIREARVQMTDEVQQYVAERRHQYPNMKEIGGGWRVRGTRSE